MSRVALGFQKLYIASNEIRKKIRRKPNARYEGTDRDNDRGGDVDMSTEESQHAQKMARPQDRPKLKHVVEVPQHPAEP